MTYKCQSCGWVGYEEDLEPETIYYECDGEMVYETYNSKCPSCHDSDNVHLINERELYKV